VHSPKQENVMSAINRRSVLAGAAAAPIAALAGDAIAATSTDTRLLELECQAAAAETAAKEAGSVFGKAEKAMFVWRRRNPKPTAYAIGPAGAKGTSDWRELDRWRKAAKDATAQWDRREAIARTNCHYDELEAFYEGLIDQADAFRDEAASISATTIDGLRCKARMLSEADLIAIGESGLLADSIIDELRGATNLACGEEAVS
jgi:hypothetical protein